MAKLFELLIYELQVYFPLFRMILWFLLSHTCGILCIDYGNKEAEVYVLSNDEPHSLVTKITF